MPKSKSSLNKEVTIFLDDMTHPLREEIDELRNIILSSHNSIQENIKWNGPNYSIGENDRITMRIQPPKQVQLVFHRGAKVLKQPKGKLIEDASGLLDWKGNDRAVITFKNMDDVKGGAKALKAIVMKWIKATK